MFRRRSWVQLRLLRARPIAAMASVVSGMRVVCDKEGIDSCFGYAHYCIGVYQRRREWPALRLRGVARKAGTACADRPILAQPYRRGRLSETDRTADAHLKRIASGLEMRVMGREVVVAVTNGRLDFGTWERIFRGQADRLARES